ncbi:variant erythrocyte surface antigen-1 family protein [Babesia caballi]|uniref:Variant erythrocyte surface antigen-1 family protein n=1 Tax=Babesia caballi TaxID=5871 RepID=A0AAV4LYY8_BABCB|nr:variant erythrocyte surface antigen-1 family protein [Babesia caballi]
MTANGKKLTDCPSNLKEAIDWILRVTGKDGQGGGNGNETHLAQAVANLPDFNAAIAAAAEKLQNNGGDAAQALRELKEHNTLGEIIKKLAEGLRKFIGYDSSSNNIGNEGIAVAGQTVNPNDRGSGYKLTYHRTEATWSSSFQSGDPTKAAQIFLGCLPLYYYWLTYLYWKCKQLHSQGGWENMNINGSGSGQNLKAFMVGHGYVADHLSTQTGKSITLLLENVDKFTSVTTTTQLSHPDLMSELKKKLDETLKSSGGNSGTIAQSHSLSALFYVCRCYFTGKQIMNSNLPDLEPRPPTSIRQMLYWLGGLQFSPHYSYLKKQIESHIPANGGLPVADSGISAAKGSTSTGDTLTQSQMKGFLYSSCLSAPGVLGAIQGNSADTDGEPWLYSLFCNSEFKLNYPSSGTAILYALSQYSYALQFQLGFLFSMCATNVNKCGWQECTYGKDINNNADGSPLQSHICQGLKCNGDSSCKHDGTKNGCKHNFNPTNNKTDYCGKVSNGSPLQAFLTDNLKGFSLSQPSDPSSHLSTCSGHRCHVPMGFQSNHLRQNAGTGNYIYAAFYSFCGRPDTPLRQLSEKLGCLTKRTPRTLGDLFGFMWHLNSQLFKNDRPKMIDLIDKFDKAFGLSNDLSSKFTTDAYSVLSVLWNHIAKLNPGSSSSSATGFSISLEAMAPTIPFFYQLFMTEDSNSLPGTLFDLNQHCHKRETTDGNVSGRTQTITITKHNGNACSNSPNDLWSLCQPVKPKPRHDNDTDPYKDCRNAQCGPYLYPLTHSAGATYAPVHASVYLSWLAYLTDDFHEWFQNFVDEFKNIDCRKTGCRSKATGGTPACISKHPPGTHGNSTDACSCDSVVHCGGVLPVLYRHGFQFYSPHTLSGGSSGNDQTKRNCHKFQSALSNVLSPEAPLAKLLESIDEFLYLFRFYFFYNQSAFWTIYVCIILYTFFFLLDTLRVRSHLHFPSSNSIAPISLLGTGKAPALEKFTKLTYFMP